MNFSMTPGMTPVSWCFDSFLIMHAGCMQDIICGSKTKNT